jgi:hypothetical protein
MDSIKVIGGIKRVMINEDPGRVVEFNPSDVVFAEKFYQIYKDFQAQEADYDRRSKELDAHRNELDKDGIPLNFNQGIEFLKEVCGSIREKIDNLFGKGTSQKVFGDSLDVYMFGEFFQGITPFIETARNEKVQQYRKQSHKKKVMD